MAFRQLYRFGRQRPLPSGLFPSSTPTRPPLLDRAPLRWYQQGARPEERGNAFLGVFLIGAAGSGLAYEGMKYKEEMEAWLCDFLAKCPCEFKNVCPVPDLPRPPRSSWTDLPVRPCVCAKETCLTCRCRSPCEWEELLAEQEKRERERKLSFKLKRLICRAVGMMGGDEEKVAARIVPEALKPNTPSSPSLTPLPETNTVGWMKDAWNAAVRTTEPRGSVASKPGEGKSLYVARPPTPEPRTPIRSPEQDPSRDGKGGGSGIRHQGVKSSDADEAPASSSLEHFPPASSVYVPSHYFTYSYPTRREEETPSSSPPPSSPSPPSRSSSSRSPDQQGPNSSFSAPKFSYGEPRVPYFKRDAQDSPSPRESALEKPPVTASPWTYFAPKKTPAPPPSLMDAAIHPKDAAPPLTSTRAPSFAPASTLTPPASLAPSTKCAPKNEPPKLFEPCPAHPRMPPRLPTLPHCDTMESLPALPPPPPCVKMPPPPPPPPPPPLPFAVVEDSPPQLPMAPKIDADLPPPPRVPPGDNIHAMPALPCLPAKLSSAAMDKCPEEEPRQCGNDSRNADTCGSGVDNNDQQSATKDTRYFNTAAIPTVPELPALPPAPTPLQPMAAPPHLTGASPSTPPIEEETAGFTDRNMTPSIRAGLIDLAPYSNHALEPREWQFDAIADAPPERTNKIRPKCKKKKKKAPPRQNSNNEDGNVGGGVVDGNIGVVDDRNIGFAIDDGGYQRRRLSTSPANEVAIDAAGDNGVAVRNDSPESEGKCQVANPIAATEDQ